jgi:hypothetical protein
MIQSLQHILYSQFKISSPKIFMGAANKVDYNIIKREKDKCIHT